VFHIVVEARHLPEYWLHLDVPADCTLEQLDHFLRQTWMESGDDPRFFSIGNVRYAGPLWEDWPWEEEEDEQVQSDIPPIRLEQQAGSAIEIPLDKLLLAISQGEETVEGMDIPEQAKELLRLVIRGVASLGPVEEMTAPVGKVLRAGMRFTYYYGLAEPTSLTLRVLSERGEEKGPWQIQLLARNIAPVIYCDNCGKPATLVCSECPPEEDRWFCQRCANKHPCDREALRPVVNSPRCGVYG
jgi:hypothetical protein